jgi:hypothetical protein
MPHKFTTRWNRSLYDFDDDIALPELQPGVIVHISRYNDVKCNAWAVVETPETSCDWATAAVIWGEISSLEEPLAALSNAHDRFVAYFGEDDLPDEAVVALARYRLLGAQT